MTPLQTLFVLLYLGGIGALVWGVVWIVRRRSTGGSEPEPVSGPPAPRDALSGLLADLQSVSADVRARAAEGLGELGDPSAVEPLVALMREESIRILRGTLGMYGGAFSVQQGWLSQGPSMESDAHERLIKAGVRRKAADALGRIGLPAAPALIEALRDRDERFLLVREECARVLGELGASGAREALEAAAAEGGTLSSVAGEALKRLGVAGTES